MNKKKELILKIIMSVLMVILLFNVAFYFIDVYWINANTNDKSFYTEHFLMAVSLFFLGVIALMMPMGLKNKNRFSGDGKGDSLIIVVGFLLIACALISIIYSFF